MVLPKLLRCPLRLRASLLARALPASLSLGLALSPALAGTPAPKGPVLETPPAHPMYLGTITSGVKTSDVYTEGNFSIVAPVWSSLGADATLSGSVIFLEPYISYGEGGEIASSLGLGFRHLFGSQPVSALSRTDAPQAGFFDEGIFIGGNVFIDMLDTEANNQFWQLGVGLEIGTRYLEVRGNYYIPLSDKQLAEETRTREVLESSRTSTSQRVVGDDPFATQNYIAQNVTYQTLATTTTSTTTIERLFRRYEEGMEGWDAEAALLVPGLDQYFDLRLIGGYYSFDNQPFGPQQGGTGNVEGWKAGVEIRPVPAIILTGTWYEDARLTGSDWTAGIQVQLPFEMGDLGDGKGFWGRMGDAFKPRRRHLAERLAEPVHRQNAAVKVANTVDVDTDTSTKTRRVTRVVSQRPGQIILEDDIIFVNNGGPVGNGIQTGNTAANGATGTAELPFNTMQEGGATAGTNSTATARLWNVYTQGGTGTDYVGGATIVEGSARLISSYTPIRGVWGKVFGGNTPRPTIQGSILATAIDTLVVSGYDVRNGYSGLITVDVKNMIFTDNTFQDFAASAIDIIAQTPDQYNLLVQNNEFRGTGGGLYAEMLNGARMNAAILGNRFYNDDLRDGIAIAALEGTLNAVIAGNEFAGIHASGVQLYAESENSLVNASIFANNFSGLFGNSAIQLTAETSATMNAEVVGNLFSGESVAIIDVNADSLPEDNGEGSSEITLNVYANYFGGSAIDAGIRLTSAEDSSILATVQQNVFDIEFYEGAETISAESFDDSLIDLDVLGNTFSSYYSQAGVYVASYDDSTLTALIKGNVFGGVLYYGVEGEKANLSQMTVTIEENQFLGITGDAAIRLSGRGNADGTSKLVGNIHRNYFGGVMGYDGIFGRKTGSAAVELNITENIFDGYVLGSAVAIMAEGGGGANSGMTAVVTDNVFQGVIVYDDAITLYSTENAKFDATITGNTLSGFAGTDFISLYTDQSGRIRATVAGNTVTADGYVEESMIYAVSRDDSRLIVEGLNNNILLGDVLNFLEVDEQDTSTLRVDGSLTLPFSNQAPALTPGVDISGAPVGKFFLNNFEFDLENP